jgi:8-hydroxy-5-deazaflavin:NADPH oxidoreductase
MQMTIVGTGNMARGIGSRALAGGHDVAFLGTDRAKAEALAGDLGGSATAADGVAGDVVVLAVPYAAAADILAAHGADLAGKVIVDITNPVDFSTFEPLTLAEGSVAGQPLDVFLAGDDDGAKATVRQIVEDGGLRAVDVGPLARARELEALGYLHMAVQGPLDTGFSSTVKIVS